jgi:hypothetical protein
MRRKKILIMISSLLVVTTTVVCLLIYYKPHRSVRKEEAAFNLSVTELVSAFSTDESKANNLYLGKVLEVKGNLKEIILNDSSLVLLLGDSTQAIGISCYLQKDQKDHYAALEKGKPVGVKGICNGMLLDIVLDKCILITE